MRYRCTNCGHIYDEEHEGVRLFKLPRDWKCPACGAEKGAYTELGLD
ncbi:MAG: rubredoxin [Nanoarchaeota archaeon]|nr:rubredoxin [Nanoarchaeota archaeon]